MKRSADAIRRSLSRNLESLREVEYLLNHPEDERWNLYSSVEEVEQLQQMYISWVDEDEIALENLEFACSW